MKNYTITVNGVSYDVSVEEKFNGNNQVQASNPMINTNSNIQNSSNNKVSNEKSTIASQSSNIQEKVTPVVLNQSSGDKKIESPMPGKILAIKASVGQLFKKGEILFVLEAMKLENEIVASEDGTMASIHVTTGEGIESGVILGTYN